MQSKIDGHYTLGVTRRS